MTLRSVVQAAEVGQVVPPTAFEVRI